VDAAMYLVLDWCLDNTSADNFQGLRRFKG